MKNKACHSLKKLFIFTIVIAFVTGCSNDEIVINQESSNQLLGEWHTVAMKLNMKTYKNSPSEKLVDVNDTNWVKKLNMQPIRTFYKADGSYNVLHLNLKDSVVLNPAGKWMIVGDTLHMMDTFPQRTDVFKYKIVFTTNQLELFGREDLDNDGKADDDYYCKQKRKQ